MNFLDLFGTLISFTSTLLFISVNRFAWIITLFATVINGWLYWQKGIYADMSLEFAYFISALYGLIIWKTPSDSKASDIKTLNSLSQWLLLITSITILYCLLRYFLSQYTNTTVAALDAITTALSLTAQWLMCRKIIITWVLWLITDAIYAYLYFIKELPFHTALMLIYTALAIIGYLNWQRRRQRQSKQKNSTVLRGVFYRK